MIYTRFGSTITLHSKRQEGNGRLSIQATSRGPTELREYDVGDREADGGFTEIDEAVAKLPWESVQQEAKRAHNVEIPKNLGIDPINNIQVLGTRVGVSLRGAPGVEVKGGKQWPE